MMTIRLTQTPRRVIRFAVRAGKTLRRIQSIRWSSPFPRAARRLGAALLLASTSALPAAAAFQYPLISARSAAMGGVSVYGASEAGALFQSPASPAGLDVSEAYFMYNKLYAGQESANFGQGLMAAAVPTRVGVLGVGIANFHAAGLLDERVASVSLSRRLFGALSGGVALKYLHHDYLTGSDPLAAADPVFANGTARGAASFDAGLRAELSEGLSAGASVRNINSPDVGLADEDRVPREYQAGASYDVRPWGLRVSGDLLFRDNKVGTAGQRTVPALGLEKRFQDERVRFRFGVNTEQVTAGVGLNVGRLGFDYAFIIARNLMSDNAGTHLLGLKYRFGEGK